MYNLVNVFYFISSLRSASSPCPPKTTPSLERQPESGTQSMCHFPFPRLLAALLTSKLSLFHPSAAAACLPSFRAQPQGIQHFCPRRRALGLRLIACCPIRGLGRIYPTDHERGGIAGIRSGSAPSGQRGRAVCQPADGVRDQDRGVNQRKMDFLPSLLDEACPVSRGMGRVVLDIVVNRGGGSRGGGC